eukprot:TRINITY_DN56963_c0_g1_i3.p1 TRINITY_DN56963_c0_g1~~TRINITY_DN56963_c0_g1_i3.p1  ORF type:complete len:159 (-),score=28.89 TRINITY_DN56963_c0_g1_i3:3-479(-)
MRTDMKDMKDMFAGLQEDVLLLRQDVSDLKSENNFLKEQNDSLTKKCLWLEHKIDDLECRSKRNNVIIHGMPRTETETKQDCENIVQDMITDTLELTDDVHIDRLHRLNGKPDSPIMDCCTFYKQKEKLLGAHHKLRGTERETSRCTSQTEGNRKRNF